MSNEINKPERATYFVAGDGAGVLHTGLTESHQVTTTGQPSLAGYDSEISYLGGLVGDADRFPPLPQPGAWLEQGDIYAHDDTLLMVRQGHTRTEHAPEDAPALFLVWREDAGDVLDWVAGEQVYAGTRRVYADVVYECIIAHVTQAGWQPPSVPNLWRVVDESPAPGEWAVGVVYSMGDVVTYNGQEYRCLQAHTSQVGWQPPNVPALWEAVP